MTGPNRLIVLLTGDKVWVRATRCKVWVLRGAKCRVWGTHIQIFLVHRAGCNHSCHAVSSKAEKQNINCWHFYKTFNLNCLTHLSRKTDVIIEFRYGMWLRDFSDSATITWKRGWINQNQQHWMLANQTSGSLFQVWEGGTYFSIIPVAFPVAYF